MYFYKYTFLYPTYLYISIYIHFFISHLFIYFYIHIFISHLFMIIKVATKAGGQNRRDAIENIFVFEIFHHLPLSIAVHFFLFLQLHGGVEEVFNCHVIGTLLQEVLYKNHISENAVNFGLERFPKSETKNKTWAWFFFVRPPSTASIFSASLVARKYSSSNLWWIMKTKIYISIIYFTDMLYFLVACKHYSLNLETFLSFFLKHI